VVFGSPVATHERAAVSPHRDLFQAVLDAIAAAASAIAAPILDDALRRGRVDHEQHDSLVGALRDPRVASTPAGAEECLVLREAHAAIRRAAPAIATPLLDAAVARGELRSDERDRVLDRLAHSPSVVLGRERMLDS
jgi:hypothetical protein